MTNVYHDSKSEKIIVYIGIMNDMILLYAGNINLALLSRSYFLIFLIYFGLRNIYNMTFLILLFCI